MNVLFLAEKYPPIVGGGETQLAQLAAGLAAMGHRVTVATDRTGVAAEPDATGVRVVHVPGLQRACKELHCYEAAQAVHALLGRERYDVLHVVNHVPALIVTWLRTAVRAPLFLSIFETFVPETRVFGLFNDFALERTLQRTVATTLDPSAVFCGSKVAREWAVDAGFDQRTLRLITHCTDVERFAFSQSARERLRAQRGWPESEFVFLVPARPVPRKRLEDVLTAAARLRMRGARVVLTSPANRGDVTYVRALEEQIACSGLNETVSWERDLTWTDMPALYSACDAVVLPSSHEGFGICLIEAMSASRPVIASDIQGPDEVVTDGVTGFLYPGGDAGALAERMSRVMKRDNGEVVKRALDLAKTQFSLNPMIGRYLAVYEEHARDGR